MQAVTVFSTLGPREFFQQGPQCNLTINFQRASHPKICWRYNQFKHLNERVCYGNISCKTYYPDIPKGVCYGQADIGVTDSFHDEAGVIKNFVPEQVSVVYSSPLKRCRMLAEYLYSDHPLQLYDELKEIDCGHWELQRWDDIPRTEIDPWMNDLVNIPTRGGESYTDLQLRVSRIFEKIHRKELPAVLVAHGGVIRSILSHITGTSTAGFL